MARASRKSIVYTGLIVAVVWLGLSVGIVLSNVVFPSPGDDDLVSVVVGYLSIFVAMFVAGFVGARIGLRRPGQVLAGVAVGALVGLLTIATFAVVDNVWLDVVAQQPTKIDGFAHSNAASMRDYINQGLAGAAVGLPIGLGFFGALFGLAGGLAGSPKGTATIRP